MLTFTEAELQAWITPLLWPFLRALALFTSLPVLGQRIVPVRVTDLRELCESPLERELFDWLNGGKGQL